MNSLQKLIALEQKTATLGFDWPNSDAILDQALSECDEIRRSIQLKEGHERLQEEAGDLLHAAISLCVFENMDVEQTLAQVVRKFGARLEAVEKIMKERGYSSLKGEPFDFLLELWHEAKSLARAARPSVATEIRYLEDRDIPKMVDGFATCGWSKPVTIFEAYLHEQFRKERLVWVAFVKGLFAGYVTLKWQSSYLPFKEKSIPEIKDLNVLPSFQRQGIGSELLDIAEDAAKTQSSLVGIGAGLYEDYGAAQRLYINRGYIPDGKGITYKYQPVVPGSSVCLDDHWVLWFTKKI